MAASIRNSVRVRLNFDDSCCYVCESALYRSFWYLVNVDRLKTVKDLAVEICSRFDIGSNLRVELSLDGCLLPHWETTAILRDNDLVSVAAVEEAASKKRKSSGSDWDRSVTSENHRKNKKKRKVFEEGEENNLVPVVAEPKEKQSRNEVKSREIVEEAGAKCGDTGSSKEKRRNRRNQDMEIFDMLDLPCDVNSVQSSTAVNSRSCLASSSENLRHPSNRLQVGQTGTDELNRNEQPEGSPIADASASSASALIDESEFGKNVKVSNGVDEANNQLNEVGLAVDGLLSEVKKKGKRTRRSRNSRKGKHPALRDPEPSKNSNFVFPHTQELPSKDVQKRSFQWQKTELLWSKTSDYSHPQHKIFDDDDDPDSRVPGGQNVFVENETALPNRSMAVRKAEQVCEGLIGSKDNVPRADRGLSSYEPKRSSDPVVHPDEQVLQLDETTSWSVAGSLLESGTVEGHGFSCRLMDTTSDSRDLSHEQKPRQVRSATDLSPFANVQVFKRQRGAKFQSPSTAEPVLTSKGNQIQAPSCTKRQMPEDIPDIKTSEMVKDYSMYELLLGPPRPGDVIAYKILQMSDDYSPVLSSYQEAKVLKFAPATRVVELERKNLKNPSQVKKSTGRFDLTIEDDNEILTNSLMQNDKLISISWDLLLEPRLVA